MKERLIQHNRNHLVKKALQVIYVVDQGPGVTKTSVVGRNGSNIEGLAENLTIDAANASFSLTNVPTNKEKKFIITNSGASEITITYPNTSDYWESPTFTIAAGKKKVTALEFNGTTRFWYLSTEMKNA